MSSILVTGGSGGIGRSIVSNLLKSYKVYNLDIKPPEKILDGETFIRVDLTSADTINSALYSVQKETLTGFVHCAGFGGHLWILQKFRKISGIKFLLSISRRHTYSLKKFCLNLRKGSTVES